MTAERSLRERWIYAAKVDSWPKLLVPFLLGQAIGLGAGGGPSLLAFAFGLAFTVCDLLFVVFLNDVGDRKVDAVKRRMFPRGCSPKTIPDRILPAYQLLLAGAGAGLAAMAVATVGGVVLDRPAFGVLGLVALLTFVAYTLPPLRLNYRGGGELLEMLGVGVLLPVLSAYVQGGGGRVTGFALLPGFASLSLASAIASGLADERSDRRGGKRTFVTLFGNRAARRAVERLTFLGALLWSGLPLVSPLPWWLGAGAGSVVVAHGLALRRASPRARTDAFDAQRAYKAHLHHAIWRGAMVAALLLTYWHLVLGRR
ncbi:MAG: prenyltransferase [Sandaracinaceae bacterium]